MADPMTGTEMRIIRTQLGLSQADLGRLIPSKHKPGSSVTRLAIRAWEEGETPIPADVAEIVRGARVELLDLIGQMVDELDAVEEEHGEPAGVDVSISDSSPQAAVRAALVDIVLRAVGWEPRYLPTEPKVKT